MKYIARLCVTEKEILKGFGLNTETSVITKIEFNAETGHIDLIVRSTESNKHTREINLQEIKKSL